MCPFCNTLTKGSQQSRGHRFNPLTGIDADYTCTHCRCEYTIKWHGRSIVAKNGMSPSEIFHARHDLAIESIAATVLSIH